MGKYNNIITFCFHVILCDQKSTAHECEFIALNSMWKNSKNRSGYKRFNFQKVFIFRIKIGPFVATPEKPMIILSEPFLNKKCIVPTQTRKIQFKKSFIFENRFWSDFCCTKLISYQIWYVTRNERLKIPPNKKNF